MLICKNCYDQTIRDRVTAFDSEIGAIQEIPDLNNQIDGAVVIDVDQMLAQLQPSQMISFLCGYCKLTHVGRDAQGQAKVKYNTEDWKNWNN